MLSRKFSVNQIYKNDFGVTKLDGMKALRAFAVNKLRKYNIVKGVLYMYGYGYPIYGYGYGNNDNSSWIWIIVVVFIIFFLFWGNNNNHNCKNF